MKKLSVVMVMSAFVATITLSPPAMANPPRLQGPTPSGESLDVVKERASKKRAEDIKLKDLRRRVAARYGISEEEVERRARPPKPRPKKVDTGSVRQRSTYGDRFRSFNLPGYILPDPRKLRPLDR
ncbi:MAG: hypothetical protein OQK12_10705 [Motiliproteus sp.]|nr:hypothetical protein [Motiliproteus sp.]MCW9054246.1 hypothetical protein [Motiliproteus sp.]